MSTSEALGGRSANRGECAQACRMPYDLIADGQKVDLGDRRYLLSPQDLAGLQVLPQLAEQGVAVVEDRGPAEKPRVRGNITRVYRQALDALAGEKSIDPLVKESPLRFGNGLFQGAVYRLVWGINNQKLVHAHFGKKRGVYLGQVKRVLPGEVLLTLEAPSTR